MISRASFCIGWYLNSMKKLIKIISGAILGLLGFSACEGGIIEMRCEYGTPHATYRILSSVKDAGGSPLKGIRTIIRRDRWQNDTLYTDESGKIFLEDPYAWPGETVDFIYEDPSGVYAKDSTLAVEPVQKEKGDGNWYKGAWEISDEKTLKEESTGE